MGAYPAKRGIRCTSHIHDDQATFGVFISGHTDAVWSELADLLLQQPEAERCARGFATGYFAAIDRRIYCPESQGRAEAGGPTQPGHVGGDKQRGARASRAVRSPVGEHPKANPGTEAAFRSGIASSSPRLREALPGTWFLLACCL